MGFEHESGYFGKPPSLVKVISTAEIRHRAGEQGPRIGWEQVVEIHGRRYVLSYWVQWETGVLLRVDSREVKS